MTFVKRLLSGVDSVGTLHDDFEEEMSKFTPEDFKPAEPVQLVGSNVEAMAVNTETGLTNARKRLEKIDAEIARLQHERANTVLAIKAGEAALSVLQTKPHVVPVSRPKYDSMTKAEALGVPKPRYDDPPSIFKPGPNVENPSSISSEELLKRTASSANAVADKGSGRGA